MMTWGITPPQWRALHHEDRQLMFRFYTWRQQREALMRKAMEAKTRMTGKIPRMR